jgi:hypothetical protein
MVMTANQQWSQIVRNHRARMLQEVMTSCRIPLKSQLARNQRAEQLLQMVRN